MADTTKAGPKPAVKSTEFYVMLGVKLILTTLVSLGLVSPELFASLIAGNGAVYGATRTVAKAKA